jgi:hypothetical protein
MRRSTRRWICRVLDCALGFLIGFAVSAAYGFWWGVGAILVGALYSCWTFYDGFTSAIEVTE